MRSRRVDFLAAVVVFFVRISPVMAVIEFKDGGVWNIDYEIADEVWVDSGLPGMETTVNILDGGLISGLGLWGFEGSIVNVVGGLISMFVPSENSTAIVAGGSISRFVASDSSTVIVSGGSIYWPWFINNSRAVVSGGLIEEALILVDNAIVTIIGSDFAVDGKDVGRIELSSLSGYDIDVEPVRRLTGTLSNGDPLNCGFKICNSAKIVLVPEPTTLLLLGLGGLALARKRRDL